MGIVARRGAAYLPQESRGGGRRIPPATLGGATLNAETKTGTKTIGYAGVLGTEPEFDAQPRSVEEIAEAVKWADGAGKAVIPWGGGGGQSYGYAPARADILLDLTRLNRLIALEPGDLTITVEAGATLASVQDALARHGQYLPLSVPDAETATIGGILATAAASDNAARDFLIGITVVDAQGRIVKGGGKVVKNVTGYDIPKMHVGALGTLGIIVEATFKTAPIPEASETLIFTDISEPFLRRLHLETQPRSAILAHANATEILTVTYSGVSEVVADDLTRSQKIALETAATSREAIPNTQHPTPNTQHPLVVRISGLPDGAAARHEALKSVAAWDSVVTFPASGVTTLALSDADRIEVALVKAAIWAETNRQKCVFLAAPLENRRGEYSLWTPTPPSLPLMRRLKQTLDPNRTLNPGRFIDKI